MVYFSVTFMVAMISPDSPIHQRDVAADLDAVGGRAVGGQRDRDRPEQPARRLHAVAHALPVGMGHEAFERREAADAQHDQVARSRAKLMCTLGSVAARACSARKPRPQAAAASARPRRGASPTWTWRSSE